MADAVAKSGVPFCIAAGPLGLTPSDDTRIETVLTPNYLAELSLRSFRLCPNWAIATSLNKYNITCHYKKACVQKMT